jgi:hypothetical protein
LRRYSKDPWFQREKIQRERTENRVERVGDVLQRLYEQAVSQSQPNVTAAKAWLDWVSRTVDKPEAEGRDLSEYTVDQLAELVGQLKADEDVKLATVTKIA